ncbi:MAG TPA: AAA family ATPase [Puia sp.]|nr:AAA family ATPase [Puia sp.]
MIIGKFMPLHKGHIALINFAREHVDELLLIICVSDKEPIDGNLRKKWVDETFASTNATSKLFFYKEDELPNTSVSSRAVSKSWADVLSKYFPSVDIIFSSEDYGDYLAEYMSARHIAYDKGRKNIFVSSTIIKENSLKYWDYIADSAKSYFVKKVVLLGSESTGKSILTERLANHFNTTFVPEMARQILEHTNDCKPFHLQQIATLHANTILSKTKTANKLLFCDTDVNITKSYSSFLFNEDLKVENWVNDANKADLYFFLETNCPYVQDGTRLSEEDRSKLSIHHKKLLEHQKVFFISITGSWDERFEKMKSIVQKTYLIE